LLCGAWFWLSAPRDFAHLHILHIPSSLRWAVMYALELALGIPPRWGYLIALVVIRW
jgi:hypothetical protein